MSNSFFSKKARLIMTLLLFLAMIGSLISDFPIGFPKQGKLKHTTGTFEIERAMESTNHVLLRQIDSSSDYRTFSCSYTPFGNEKSSSCGDTKYLESYRDKVITIGWYEIDKFLWFKNDMPQLVTIEKNGEVMRSYEQTATNVSDRRNSSLYIFLPLAFIIGLLVYWFLGKVR